MLGIGIVIWNDDISTKVKLVVIIVAMIVLFDFLLHLITRTAQTVNTIQKRQVYKPSNNASENTEQAVFNNISCKRLEIIDSEPDNPNVGSIILSAGEDKASIAMYTPVPGAPLVTISTREGQGGIDIIGNIGSAGIRVEKDGSRIYVDGKDDSAAGIIVDERGSQVILCGKDGNTSAGMHTQDNGNRIVLNDKDGSIATGMHIHEEGAQMFIVGQNGKKITLGVEGNKAQIKANTVRAKEYFEPDEE